MPKVGDNFEFWDRNSQSMMDLYEIAIKVLQTPATSASIERVFSFAALTNGTKNRRASLSDISLTAETFLKVNKDFL